MKFPQEYDDGCNITLDNLNGKGKNDSRVQAVFKRSTHNTLSIIIISQDYYDFQKRTMRTNGKNYHIFKHENYREVQNLHQDKASMDMTLNEIKPSTSTCWNKKYQPLTIDMTKS